MKSIKDKIIIRELEALGQYWRNDWSDFDGRTLRNQLEKITSWINSNNSVDFTEFTEMLKFQKEEYEED